MQYFNLNDYDVVFLSYDEPNADNNYLQLSTLIPRAKRVKNVKGSDNAHKICAALAKTDRVIIVDGDNYVHTNFLNYTVELPDNIDASNAVFSFPSKNCVNGLAYGNGGIKCWPKQTILNMRTHENAENNNPHTKVDFCWEVPYIPFDISFSTTMINGSPLQAFRAGFREGVKMLLNSGERPSDVSILNKWNLNRLKTWLSVGVDIEYGEYCILGAHLGAYELLNTNWDYVQVRDFDFLNNYFQTHINNLDREQVFSLIEVKKKILESILGPISVFSSIDSKFYKSLDNNQPRQRNDVHCHCNYTGYDIVMITYDEKYAYENYMKLLARFPTAKRIHGVKGIHQAHIQAAKLSNTEMFWVVDGDSEIDSSFNFDFMLPNTDEYVRVWRCKNPVNDLVYGYGGVKLLPKQSTMNMDVNKPDMTTGISNLFIPVQQLSNKTNFNVDEFSAFRAAFRECCKLSSKIIDRQKDEETNKRLNIWCTVGADRPYGEYVIKGAITGRKYGEENKGNIEALKKINDFDWLREIFNANTRHST